MMTREFTWTVICDRCGATEEEKYADYQQAKIRFQVAGWENDGAKWFCPKCAEERLNETS